MKIITWNVNGLRACMEKGFMDYFCSSDADMFCIQETKMQPEQASYVLDGYEQLWNSAERKGYSGTAVFTRHKPLSVGFNNGFDGHPQEGRVIICEYEKFYLVNAYVPNAQRELTRLDYRMKWEDALSELLCGLDKVKPVIYCGDLNVAHNEIDLKNYKTNHGNAGFTDEERGKLTALLSRGFTDAFRRLYPDRTGAYSWWSYMFHAREKNAGWRIDYFLVSERIMDKVSDCVIRSDIFGSDHCPVELIIDL